MRYSQQHTRAHVFSDDRVLAEPFMKLPTARELPDYYERIERPMDFKRIQKKLDKYHNIDEMADDVFLLCSNAQEYNVDESIIYQVHIRMHAAHLNICAGFGFVEEDLGRFARSIP
jgi:SWI/SNF-related matrix-associated actin-dependent regulator of chromatin subfamily A protein 2/4